MWKSHEGLSCGCGMGRRVTAGLSVTGREADGEQSAVRGQTRCPCADHTGRASGTHGCFLPCDINILRGFLWPQGAEHGTPVCLFLGPCSPQDRFSHVVNPWGEVLVVIQFSFMRMNCN